MSKFENNYKKLISRVLVDGIQTTNRTGVNTITLFVEGFKIDLRQGFPIVTGKFIAFDKAIAEYEWITQGGSTLDYLHKNNVHFWDDFADNKGTIRYSYGQLLKSFNGEVDQIEKAIHEIRNNSRRAVISLWNPSITDKQSLPACYTSMTFVRIHNELHMSMDFRSSDIVLGLPFDIIFGALLLTNIAKHCHLEPVMLKINIANAHIYVNQLQQARRYLGEAIYKLPKYDLENKQLINYKHGAFIKTPLNK